MKACVKTKGMYCNFDKIEQLRHRGLQSNQPRHSELQARYDSLSEIACNWKNENVRQLRVGVENYKIITFWIIEMKDSRRKEYLVLKASGRNFNRIEMQCPVSS